MPKEGDEFVVLQLSVLVRIVLGDEVLDFFIGQTDLTEDRLSLSDRHGPTLVLIELVEHLPHSFNPIDTKEKTIDSLHFRKDTSTAGKSIQSVYRQNLRRLMLR